MWKFVFVGKGKTTMGIMSKIFGTRSQREVKRLQPLVGQIEALGPACQKLSDGDLAAKTKEFQQRYQNGETLMPSCRRPLPPAGRRRTGFWACDPTRCS